MLIGSNRKLTGNASLQISIHDQNIGSLKSFKYLGISSNFTWTEHVEHRPIAKLINQRLSLLRRIKVFLPFKSRVLFYNSLILPIFDYADIVWGDKNNNTLMVTLQVLQSKAAKIILDKPFHSSSTEALALLKWIPLDKRRFERRCIYMYKCLNGLVNHHMTSETQQDCHGYNTRNKDELRGCLPKILLPTYALKNIFPS
ncbi:uncharacterized protein LOC114539747 [Dendronephthya gigantea]|uniref:uncharacterized protein LOC114539747 n=1 Tax=Dendronephthya gigantea TaxID=151771 RepID=UPI00106B8ACF|nr:uncharacterized protein LOC114539747 [Dendronephthya gigantea]